MFENDLFEFFSRIPPWQPPAIYIPAIVWACWSAFSAGIGVLPFFGLYLAGVLNWSLMEYWLHRKLFHYEPTSKFGKRFFWIIHGVHHDWPNDKFRLVFPPAVSVPLAILFFIVYTAVFGEVHRYAVFAGLASGYLSYDMIHYYVHHFAPKHAAGKFLRRYHLAHHFKDGSTGFGVSMPIWDYVFGTKPNTKS